MKKLVVAIILSLLFITGCGSKELDLKSINSKLGETNLFNDAKSVELEFLERKYGLDTEGISEYTVYMSESLSSASMYAIFKTDSTDTDEKIQETFIDKYVFSWTNVVYNEEEAYLVNNMYKEKYGDYLIYIVSRDNDKALKIIKG